MLKWHYAEFCSTAVHRRSRPCRRGSRARRLPTTPGRTGASPKTPTWNASRLCNGSISNTWHYRSGVPTSTIPATGVIAVLPPDTPEPDEATVEKIVELHGDRFERVLQADEQLSALPVPDNAWSLATIGTMPRSRGTGLGSALLKHALAELDRTEQNCWLDTSTERNLPLYQRFGFTIAGEISLTDGPTVWRMHRLQG